VPKQYTMKVYRGSGSKVHILDLSCRWKWVVSFMLWPLYLWGKETMLLIG